MKMADTALLDFLDSLEVPDGFGWQLRISSTGRGFRLLTTSRTPNYKTAREAIERAVCPECEGEGSILIDNCQAGDQTLQEYDECPECLGTKIRFIPAEWW